MNSPSPEPDDARREPEASPPAAAAGRTSGRLRFVPWLLLAAILLLGGTLRFHRIETRQPRISDEADYLMEAFWVSSLAHAAWDSFTLFREEQRTGRDVWKKDVQLERIRTALRGHAPYLARPGHVLLIALCMEWLEDPYLAGAWESALFGVLTIFLLVLLGRLLYGWREGLLAGLLLAVSAYHVWYSRTGFAEADTTCFLVLVVLLYVLARQRNRTGLFALTGLAAGLGFLVHHRFILFLAGLWCLEAVRLLRSGSAEGRRTWLVQVAALHGCFALPLLLVEFAYHLAFIGLQAMGKTLPCPTYFSQLLLVLAYIKVNNLIPYAHFFTWSNFLTYPYLFWLFEGPLFCALLLAGIVLLGVRRSRPEALLALFLLAPLLFYSYQNANARFACGTVPFAALAMSLALCALPDLATRRRPSCVRAAWAMVALLLAGQSLFAWGRIRANDRLEADYRAVARHLEASGSPKNLNVYPHMAKLYLGEASSRPPPPTVEEMARLHGEGYRWLVLVDFLDYYMERFDIPELRRRLPSVRSLLETRPLLRRIRAEETPVFTAPCSFCASPLNILEINLNFDKSLAFVRHAEENGLDKIRVYDLGTILDHR